MLPIFRAKWRNGKGFVFHHGGAEKSQRFTEKFKNSAALCVISVPLW
jgi:hypothetical protein